MHVPGDIVAMDHSEQYLCTDSWSWHEYITKSGQLDDPSAHGRKFHHFGFCRPLGSLIPSCIARDQNLYITATVVEAEQ